MSEEASGEMSKKEFLQEFAEKQTEIKVLFGRHSVTGIIKKVGGEMVTMELLPTGDHTHIVIGEIVGFVEPELKKPTGVIGA